MSTASGSTVHSDPAQGCTSAARIALRDGGLVAPAIHDADRKDVDTVMTELMDLVARARRGTLRSSELADPTVTVTNLGDLGVEVAFAVIYPPQVAIVGFGKMMARPWVVDGKIEPRGDIPLRHRTPAADAGAAMTHPEIQEKIVQALMSVAPEIESASLAPDIAVRDQVDLDSMDFLRFVIALNQQFGIDVPEADDQKLATLASAVDYVAARSQSR